LLGVFPEFEKKSPPPTTNDPDHEGPSNIRRTTHPCLLSVFPARREVNLNELPYDLADRKRISVIFGLRSVNYKLNFFGYIKKFLINISCT
jgi:hypothetical protein